MTPPTLEERLRVCRKHLTESIRWKGERLGILEMRRHYSNYFKGFSHFKDFRMRLVTSLDLDEIYSTLEEVFVFYSSMEEVGAS